MFSLAQTVSEPTHGHGHILDLVFHRDSDNLIYSTRTCYDLSLLLIISPFFADSVSKPIHTVKFESICCIRKINMDNFSVDTANGIAPNMSLPDLNQHLSKVLDTHAPVCQRKVCQQRPSPWYSSVADQLHELKRERQRAEHCWRSLCLTIHKQLCDAAKQKVIDLVHDAKTSFYSTMVSSSVTCKELFHNMTILLGETNPLFLVLMIFNNFHTSSVTFSKTKSSPFETAFHVWHRRKTTVSSHFLAPHFFPLQQFLNNLLKRLSFRLSPRLRA